VTTAAANQVSPESLLHKSLLPNGVRLFHSDKPKPCENDPDGWFNPHRSTRAIKECQSCHFLGRCAFNAVANGVTHGVVAGIQLPGDYPRKLAPIYPQLIELFNQRRAIELGDTPVPGLPDYIPPMTAGYWEDVWFVRIALRGGDWQIGLRIARRVQVGAGNGRPPKTGKNLPVPERKSLREVAKDIGVSHPTVMKYFAAWEWAADAGIVTPAAELDYQADYDLSALTQDQWRQFYRTACDNPPPWNPQGKPLEPRRETVNDTAIPEATEAEVSQRSIFEVVNGHPVTDNKVADMAGRDIPAKTDAHVSTATLADVRMVYRRAKRDLNDMLNAVNQLRGVDDESRAAIVAIVQELRGQLLAIEQATAGQLDAELAALLAS
jgi:WhiB family transcriptional regulator, redox-sensing transcriptional regulator